MGRWRVVLFVFSVLVAGAQSGLATTQQAGDEPSGYWRVIGDDGVWLLGGLGPALEPDGSGGTREVNRFMVVPDNASVGSRVTWFWDYDAQRVAVASIRFTESWPASLDGGSSWHSETIYRQSPAWQAPPCALEFLVQSHAARGALRTGACWLDGAGTVEAATWNQIAGGWEADLILSPAGESARAAIHASEKGFVVSVARPWDAVRWGMEPVETSGRGLVPPAFLALERHRAEPVRIGPMRPADPMPWGPSWSGNRYSLERAWDEVSAHVGLITFREDHPDAIVADARLHVDWDHLGSSRVAAGYAWVFLITDGEDAVEGTAAWRSNIVASLPITPPMDVSVARAPAPAPHVLGPERADLSWIIEAIRATDHELREAGLLDPPDVLGIQRSGGRDGVFMTTSRPLPGSPPASLFGDAPSQTATTHWNWSLDAQGRFLSIQERGVSKPPPSMQSDAGTVLPAGPQAGQGAQPWEVAMMYTGGVAGALWFLHMLLLRIRAGRVLEHPARAHLTRVVRGQPGIHRAALQRALGLSDGQIGHHLQVLVKHGILRVQQRGGYSLVYPADQEGDDLQAYAVATPAACDLLATIVGTPGIATGALCSALGMSRATISRHGKRLAEVGLIIREMRTGEMHYWPAQSAHHGSETGPMAEGR